jgi:hypothetical protein
MGDKMPRYVIERTLPGAGQLSARDLKALSIKSREVLHALGPQINWIESYVTDNKLYCIYVAPDAQMIEEHARRGGFPADSVSQVRAIISPTTAE